MGIGMMCLRRAAIVAALAGGSLIAIAGAGWCASGMVWGGGLCAAGVRSLAGLIGV